MSSASSVFRQSSSEGVTPENESAAFPPADPSQACELPLTPELIAAFKECLSSRRISIRFFDGSWDSFAIPKPYDLILTSETIYRQDSLRSLISLLAQAACGPKEGTQSLEALSRDQLRINDGKRNEPICLVAAKLVYFGVGGGVSEFKRAVREYRFDDSESRRTEENSQTQRATKRTGGGEVYTIWEHAEGVKRCVMSVQWRS